MSSFENNNINNPFGVPNTARPNLGALASKFLSARDAEQLKNLFKNKGGQDSSNPSITDIPANVLEKAMGDEERKKLEEEKERRDIPKQITTWAKKYKLGDEDWVEKYFEFNDDGSVICNTNLNLNFMTEPDFPESIKYVKGYLFLDGLTSATDLNLPDEIRGNLSLNRLTSITGLTLPNRIGGGLYLDGLTSATGLNLPDEIRGDLSLDGLTSAEGLKLPNLIGEDLYLNNLTSIVGLELTDVAIGKYIYLKKIPYNEEKKLREKYPSLRIY